MLAKVAIFFIIFMMVLGMFGKLKTPRIGKNKPAKNAKKCKSCGTYLIGNAPCPCKKKR